VPLADGSLLVTANVSTHVRISRVEPGSGKARTLLDQRGWLSSLSASRDGQTIAFVTTDSRHFPEIYVAQGPDGMAGARPVTDFNAALTREPLPEIETVSWDDGEGSTVEGALFWPPGRKGEKNLPLIVDLHGGPFSVARTEAVSLQASPQRRQVIVIFDVAVSYWRDAKVLGALPSGAPPGGVPVSHRSSARTRIA